MFLELKNVHFSYMKGTKIEKPALKGINLSIKEGEIIGIVGPTGSGKSTLVQHLNGLLQPDKGKVYVKGKAVGETIRPGRIRKDIGLVFQFPERQFFEETVFDEVAFGAKNTGLSGEKLVNRVSLSLSMVALDHSRIRDRSPFSLSGGEMRRVAIASVLAMNPEVLILDEPTSGLDAKSREELIKSIKMLQRENNLTVIWISHEIDEIAAIAERIIVINEGEIVLDDSPEKIFAHADDLKRMGLGIPQITLLMMELALKGHSVPSSIFKPEEAKKALLSYFKA